MEFSCDLYSMSTCVPIQRAPFNKLISIPGSAPTLTFLFISTCLVLFQGLVQDMEPSKQVNSHALTQKILSHYAQDPLYVSFVTPVHHISQRWLHEQDGNKYF